MIETTERTILASPSYTAESVIEFQGKAFTFGVDAFSTIGDALAVCDGTTPTEIVLQGDFAETVLMRSHTHLKSYTMFLDNAEGAALPKITGSVSFGKESNASIQYLDIESTSNAVFNTAIEQVDNIQVLNCNIKSTGVRPSAGHGCHFSYVNNLLIDRCTFSVVQVAPDGVENANAVVLNNAMMTEISNNAVTSGCDGVYIPSVYPEFGKNTVNVHDNVFTGVLFGVAVHFLKTAATLLFRNNKITAERWGYDFYQLDAGLQHVVSISGNNYTTTNKCVYFENTLKDCLSFALQDELYGYIATDSDVKFYRTNAIRNEHQTADGNTMSRISTASDGSVRAEKIAISNETSLSVTDESGMPQNYIRPFNIAASLEDVEDAEAEVRVMKDIELVEQMLECSKLVIPEGVTVTVKKSSLTSALGPQIVIDGTLEFASADNLADGHFSGIGTIKTAIPAEELVSRAIAVDLNGYLTEFTGTINVASGDCQINSVVLPDSLTISGNQTSLKSAAHAVIFKDTVELAQGKTTCKLTLENATVMLPDTNIFTFAKITGSWSQVYVGQFGMTSIANNMSYVVDGSSLESGKFGIAVFGPSASTVIPTAFLTTSVAVPFNRFCGSGANTSYACPVVLNAMDGATGDRLMGGCAQSLFNNLLTVNVAAGTGSITRVWGLCNAASSDNVMINYTSGKTLRLIGSNYDADTTDGNARSANEIVIDVTGGELGQIRGMSSTTQRSTDPAAMTKEFQNFEANKVTISVKNATVTDKIYGGSLAKIKEIVIMAGEGATINQIVAGSKFVAYGTTKVLVQSGATVGEIYGGAAGGNDLFGYSQGTSSKIIVHGTVTGNIIGGGYGGDQLIASTVELNDAAKVGGVIYLGTGPEVLAEGALPSKVKNAILRLNGIPRQMGTSIESNAGITYIDNVCGGQVVSVPISVASPVLKINTLRMRAALTANTIEVSDALILEGTQAELTAGMLHATEVEGPVTVRFTENPTGSVDLKQIIDVDDITALDLTVLLDDEIEATTSSVVKVQDGVTGLVLTDGVLQYVAPTKESATELARKLNGSVEADIDTTGTPVSEEFAYSLGEYATPNNHTYTYKDGFSLLVQKDGELTYHPTDAYVAKFHQDTPYTLTHTLKFEDANLDFQAMGLRFYLYRFVYRSDATIIRVSNLLQNVIAQQGAQQDRPPRYEFTADMKKATIKIVEKDSIFANMPISCAAIICSDIEPTDGMIASMEQYAVEKIKEHLAANRVEVPEVASVATPQDLVKRELMISGQALLMTKTPINAVKSFALLDAIGNLESIADQYVAMDAFVVEWLKSSETDKIRIAMNVYETAKL